MLLPVIQQTVQTPGVQPVDLQPILEKLRIALKPVTQAHHVFLSIHARENLPLCLSEPIMLETVAAYILNHAIRATPTNGEVSVRLYPSVDKAWLMCEFRIICSVAVADEDTAMNPANVLRHPALSPGVDGIGAWMRQHGGDFLEVLEEDGTPVQCLRLPII
jgi:hypothetical protein